MSLKRLREPFLQNAVIQWRGVTSTQKKKKKVESVVNWNKTKTESYCQWIYIYTVLSWGGTFFFTYLFIRYINNVRLSNLRSIKVTMVYSSHSINICKRSYKKYPDIKQSASFYTALRSITINTKKNRCLYRIALPFEICILWNYPKDIHMKGSKTDSYVTLKAPLPTKHLIYWSYIYIYRKRYGTISLLKIINSVPSSSAKLAWIITCCLNIHSSIYLYIYIHPRTKI